MPRDPSDVYYLPPGSEGVPDTTIESIKYNLFIEDVEQDLNRPRPIVAGGTGASSANEAMAALGGELALQHITNFDADYMQPGSFYSSAGATNAPVTGHAFVGTIVTSDIPTIPPANLNVVITAHDQNDTQVPGRNYMREMKAGVWGDWKPAGGTTIIGGAEGIAAHDGDMFFGIEGTGAGATFLVNSKADNSGTDLIRVEKDGSVTVTADPVNLMDVATKNYVDNQVGISGTSAKAYIDAQDAALQSQITANAGAITTANANIATNTGNIATNTTAISNLNTNKADKTYVDAQDATLAPKASPVFTGDPRAPTPAPGDNDTSLATTAWVNTAMANAGVGAAPLSQRVATFANEDYAVSPTSGPFTTVIMQDGSMRTAGQATGGNPDWSNPGWGGTTLADLRRIALPVGLLGTPQKIVQNYLSTFVITDQGDVCCCGYNNGGELGMGDTVARSNLTLLPATNIGPRSAGGSSRRIVEIGVARSADSNTTTQLTTLFRCADGTLWAAGYNQTGACAQGNTTSTAGALVQCKKTGSVLVTDAAKVCVDTCSTNGCSVAYIDTSGKVWLAGSLNNGSWGRNTTTGSQTLFNQPMTTTDIGTSDLPAAYVAVDVQFMMMQVTYVLCADKNIYAFGYGTSANIGNGASAQVSVPKKVGGTAAGTVQGNIERMFCLNYRNDAQNNAVMFQLTNGACYFFGNCANNATACTPTGLQNSPVIGLGRLAAGCPVVNKIICGSSASTAPTANVIALLADGTAWCWGGARTDFTGAATVASSTPIQIVMPSRVGSPAVSKIHGSAFYNAGSTPGYSSIGITWADGSVMGGNFWSYPCGPGGIGVPNASLADWAFLIR